MGLYVKKPLVVSAWQWGAPEPSWLRSAYLDGDIWFQGGPEPYITVNTLEGEMRAVPGDWIIRGIAGEFYPCKPDIFAASYEPADSGAQSAPSPDASPANVPNALKKEDGKAYLAGGFE